MKTVLFVPTVITVIICSIHHITVVANESYRSAIEHSSSVHPSGDSRFKFKSSGQCHVKKTYYASAALNDQSAVIDQSNDEKKVVAKSQASSRSSQSKKHSLTKYPVTTFTIVTGTVKENAENLLRLFGWKLYRWDASNFYIDTEYAVEIASLSEGLEFLLDPYPIQANMINVNKTVLFINKSKITHE